MHRLCVFCGSSAGHDPVYARLAAELGRTLAQRGVGLVYGGGRVGLMGVLADAMLAQGAEVIGVIPRGLVARELGHQGLTELRIVDSMHERKATMASLSDGFMALPGGLGTLEETLEMLTWVQLGIHAKPVGLLNALRYYDGLVALLSHALAEGFVRPEYAGLLLTEDSAPALLDRMSDWRPPPEVRPWLVPAER